jgi:hypothetical protein
VLAVAAGLSLTAPRAAADCTTHIPRLGAYDLPFPAGPLAAPHKDAPRRPGPTPRRCPCEGPHCRQVPADPAPPPPAPPRSSPSQECAWLQGDPAPSIAAGHAWGDGDRLLAPLFSPSPLERPPR